MTDIVTGAVSTVSGLGKDEGWLKGWLEEQPNRLGLGELSASERDGDDEGALVVTDDERCFSVDVQLGEMEASRGFQLLDDWARNRVLHPDKTHVAVLVTEAIGDRYQTTLQTLAEHLPLVVVELQVWKGENEAIVIPHVALSSDDVDLADTPAAKAAEAVAKTAVETPVEPETPTETVAEAETPAETETPAAATTEASAQGETESVVGEEAPEVVTEAEAVAAEAEAQADAELADDAEQTENKDDTGVGNPWGLEGSGAGSTGLLTKVGQ